jgi:uncharacterized membrane protein
MDVYAGLLAVHGVAGATALLTFWMAAFARKGSPLHRGSGKTYLIAMLAVMATALPMAGFFLARGKPGTATFLFYLVVITATSCWLGWRAVRRKADQRGFRDRRYAAVAVFNLLTALVVAVYGVLHGQALMMGFSLVGIGIGSQMLWRVRQPLPPQRWWLREHLGAMLGCGAATHVAFLSIGLNRVLDGLQVSPPQGFGMIAWFLPVAVSTAFALWLDRRHAPHPPRTPVAVRSPLADPATPIGGH